MKVTINQITPRRTGSDITSVNVHFTARTDDGDINLSGSIPIEEFTDKIDFDGLEDTVRQELINKIMNGEIDAE